MFYVIIGFVLLVVGGLALLRRNAPSAGPATPAQNAIAVFSGPLGGIIMILAGLLFLASTSFVLVSADKVGHLKRVYLADDLPPGHIIALPGQKGPQAEVLGPGFHFRPLLNVFYDIESFDLVQVPEGYYGQVTTLDGAPMPDGMFMAPVPTASTATCSM